MASFNRKAIRAGFYGVLLDSGFQKIYVANINLKSASGSVKQTVHVELKY